MKITTKTITRAGIIAAVYVALTAVLAPVSFGIIQFRAAEALTMLPVLFPESIPGLYIGCIIANIIGGLGPWDIWGGSFVTLLAAYLTHRLKGTVYAYLSPILLNGFLISLYLKFIFKLPYWVTVLGITASEAVVVVALGLPLVKGLQRTRLGD